VKSGPEPRVTRWPNLFLVGAPRAGTTSFYDYLRQHPDIYMSPVKEPGFFSPEAKPEPWVDRSFDETQYLDLFRGGDSQKLLGEASTTYLWVPEAASRIRAHSPEAKILIVLREPVERAYSHYLMQVRDGVEHRPFIDALREPARPGIPSYADRGLYCEQVRRYFDLFGDRVLVLFFEEAFADVRGALRRTFAFLEVDPDFADEVRLEWHHHYARPREGLGRLLVTLAGKARWRLGRPLVPSFVQPLARRLLLTTAEKPSLDPKARAYLEELYRDQRECLKTLLGVDPPWRDYDRGLEPR
jgi:hypothetical protein